METALRCNSLSCRNELNDHAVVTTCSHIFCVDCSNRCQLSGGREGQRPICPACDMHLMNPDDVVVTNLNPTEDYKTSVLSGLSPNIIMECAGRALSFWAYQTTQEVVYQEYLAKNSTDKYASLNTQVDKIVHDANGEISGLRTKMSNMTMDQENLRRKNEELIQALREKSRKQLQTQELYDKLKRRALLGQVQIAAGDAADHQASVAADRFIDRVTNAGQQRSGHDAQYSNLQSDIAQNGGIPPPSNHNMGPPPGRLGGANGSWNTINSQSAVRQNQPLQTPSTHRQRLAPGNNLSPRTGLPKFVNSNISATPMMSRPSTGRSPLGTLNGNNGFAGYGMSAGLKISNPTSAQSIRPVARSRVAQRPVSAFPSTTNPSFNATSNGGQTLLNGVNEDRYYGQFTGHT